MVCKNCGSELSDSAKFCSKCGSSQKSSDTASKQLNDYSEVLKHIKDSNNNKSSSVDSEKVKEMEEKVCTTIGGILLLLYIIGVGLSLKSVIIGGIIGYIIGWPISKVIGFLYKIISCSGNFVKEFATEYWKQEPVYIKVNQLQEMACQKYMQMSIAEYDVFRTKFFNTLPDKFGKIEELKKLSKQMPSYSLEQLIDTYYSGLLNQAMKTYISGLEDTLKQLRQCHETEKNKYSAETLQQLSSCENSLEEFINGIDDMSYSDFLERKKEIQNMLNELNQEFERAKEKERIDRELRVKEEQQRCKEEEHRKAEAEQRRKDFPPAYYTDVHKANIKLYELKYNKFYQEQLEKFDPVRLATDELAKEFYTYENKKETNYKLKESEKKLIAVICHTIDAIRYDDDSLIAKLPAERAAYKRMFEEAKQSFSDNYSKTNSNASSDLADALLSYGLASAGRKLLCKCGDCVYYRQGYCYEKNKSVSKSGGSCSCFKYNE